MKRTASENHKNERENGMDKEHKKKSDTVCVKEYEVTR